MAAQRLTLHLDPVRSAANLLTIIDVLGKTARDSYPSFAAISDRIREEYDFTDRTEPLSLACLLGLLDQGDGVVRLSATAQAILTMSPRAQPDLLHFLLMTAWHDGADPALGCAWSYRSFCERLWSHGAVRLAADETKRTVADLLDLAQAVFPDLRLAALSPKSVLGMRKWLELLDPPVFAGDEFNRREVCSPELLLLAIGQVVFLDGAEIGIDLLLTPQRREAICQLCLLEPGSLDRSLDRTLPIYPTFIEHGTRTGAYGRFIRLRQRPSVEGLTAAG